MATVAGVSIATPTVFAKASDYSKSNSVKFALLNTPWKTQFKNSRMYVRPVAAAPDRLSSKVEESIKGAQEACSDDPVSGECAAAWDEVEELSAAASHARDKTKDSDPLEEYCKDNPETDEIHLRGLRPLAGKALTVCQPKESFEFVGSYNAPKPRPTREVWVENFCCFEGL
ncbi:hypothetical protein BUALT_Bualt02G0242100 [Buddleja alternifolia]|uniref:CP12 domain-containing protein n=1 Tax=Buddleja alternifolia TaxID=168488 RepID=A0AAV6Y8Z1_9LAMI|nr:hypothetical protein BUALT_Bualt02G0242100 [Buddleja alternifolia]